MSCPNGGRLITLPVIALFLASAVAATAQERAVGPSPAAHAVKAAEPPLIDGRVTDDPAWQGVREVAEQLTAAWDWCEVVFATNIVFEPLVGELFRSQLVQHAAPHNGDFVTPTVVGAGEYDYAQRDLRYTRAMFQLLTGDREFAAHNKEILQRWLSTWTERSITAARKLQPLWSQSDARPPRFEEAMDTVKNRFAGILTDLDLQAPNELSH